MPYPDHRLILQQGQAFVSKLYQAGDAILSQRRLAAFEPAKVEGLAGQQASAEREAPTGVVLGGSLLVLDNRDGLRGWGSPSSQWDAG